jgi:hypothetical protein
MKSKQLQDVQIVDEAEGRVKAIFATLNVKDHDGDVTLPGAFEKGARVRVSAYNHASWGPGQLPVGKGTIGEQGENAVADLEFFMNTTHGRDTFTVVKELGDMGEWSYGYDIVEAEPGKTKEGDKVQFLKKLKVHEVSPVLLGAGLGTRTLSAKRRQDDGGLGAIEFKSTETTEDAWDGTRALAKASNAEDLEAISAWKDPDGDPDHRGSYKFAHHDAADGPANLAACHQIIAVLNGGRGGSSIPDEDRKGVYDHAAGHLRDAGRDVPELRPAEPGAIKLYDRLAFVNHEVEEVTERLSAAVAQRAEQGQKLSPDTIAVALLLKSNAERLREALAIEPPVSKEWRGAHARLARSLQLLSKGKVPL